MVRQVIRNQWVRAIAFIVIIVALLWAMYRARGILIPFFVAFAMAYLLDPIVDRIEEWQVPFTSWHPPRALAVSVVFLAGMLVGLLTVLLMVPTLIDQISTFGTKLEGFRDQRLPQLIQTIETTTGIEMPHNSEQLLDRIAANAETLKELGRNILPPVGGLVQAALTSLFDSVLVILNWLIAPILMFYLLKDIDTIRDQLADYVPHGYREWTYTRMREVDKILSSFVRGQLTVALILSVMYSIGLGLIGLPLWLVVGFIAGFGNVVPYLGTIIGVVMSMLLMLLEHPDLTHLAGVAIVFVVVQTFEGLLISPKVVGDTVGIHPVVVMMALLLGGEFFGFLGILLAVPATAAASVFWTDAVERYKSSQLFRGATSNAEDATSGT